MKKILSLAIVFAAVCAFADAVPVATEVWKLMTKKQYAEAEKLFRIIAKSDNFDGINGLSISNAAHLSAWKNNKWVDLPNDGEEFWEELQKKIAASQGKDESVVTGGVADLSGTYNSK